MNLFHSENPRDILILRESLEEFERILETLSEREKTIIKLRFYEEKTLRECGEILNLHSERIRQIQNKTLRKLRHPKVNKKIAECFDIPFKKIKFEEFQKKRPIIKKEVKIEIEKESKNSYEFWKPRIKFTQVYGNPKDHPYYLPSTKEEEKSKRILAYAYYYEVELEELKLIFNEEDIRMATTYRDSQ